MTPREMLRHSLARVVLSVYLDGFRDGIRAGDLQAMLPVKGIDLSTFTGDPRPLLDIALRSEAEGPALDEIAGRFLDHWFPTLADLRKLADGDPNLDRLVGTYCRVREVCGLPPVSFQGAKT